MTPAAAQQSVGVAAERIDTAFGLAPENTVELAVPLTRRALARRALARKAKAQQIAGAAPPALQEPASFLQEPLQLALPSETDTASAEDPGWDAVQPDASADAMAAEGDADEGAEIARLPRARPGRADDSRGLVEVPANGDQALDLVAAPPLADAPEQPLAGNPRPGPIVMAALASIRMPPPAAIEASPRLAQAVPEGAAQASADTARQSVSAPRQKCLAVKDVADKDGDFNRNAALLSDPGFCIQQQKFKERRRPWIVQTVESGRPGPLWTVMHDDEADSFDTAAWGLKTYGGRLVTVETGGKRNQDGIDPNRNFSDAEISCGKLGPAAAPVFTAAVVKGMASGQPIIALHNNYDGDVPTGGLGHVSMSTVPRDMRVAKSRDPDGPLAGAHNLVLLAAAAPVDSSVDALMAKLSGKSVNVVLEPVQKGRGDCSLSNYIALSGHSGYFNVTVDHDQSERQRKIVGVVLADDATVATAQ